MLSSKRAEASWDMIAELLQIFYSINLGIVEGERKEPEPSN